MLAYQFRDTNPGAIWQPTRVVALVIRGYRIVTRQRDIMFRDLDIVTQCTLFALVAAPRAELIAQFALVDSLRPLLSQF